MGAKDWKVSLVVDKGKGHYYRYIVEGENLNRPVGHPDRAFRWAIHSLECPRYDFAESYFETTV